MTQDEKDSEKQSDEQISNLRKAVDNIQSHQIILKDVNFLNHIGYFCHDDHQAANRLTPCSFSDRITLEGSPFQLDYTVTPDPRYGYPGTIAYKIWDWVDSVLTFYGRPAKNPIFFDIPTLRHVCGLTKTGGNDKLIRKALNQLRHTDIHTKCYRLGKGQWIKLSYRLIESIVEFGEKNEVRGGLVSISQPLLTSYNNSLHLPLNKDIYLDTLKTSTTRALYAMFFRAFYAARKAGAEVPVVTKNYQSLCAQLGYKPHPFKSLIIQQLSKHMTALEHPDTGLIQSWEVLPNNTRSGFNIRVTAAKDFNATNFSHQNNPLTTIFPEKKGASQEEILAMESVFYFLQKRFSLNENESFVSPKDVANMQQFIKILPQGTDPKIFIDYCLTEAEKQSFQLASVGGMKIFINSFLGEKIPSLQKNKLIEKKRKQTDQNETLRQLHDEFLMLVWRSLENDNPEEAEKFTKIFHNEVLKDSVVLKAFNEGGENSITYSSMIKNCRIELAKKIATKTAWDAFLSQSGKIQFSPFFPGLK